MKISFQVMALAILFVACGRSSDDELSNGKVVATAFGAKLYLNDLVQQIPDGISKDDSTYMAERAISEWVKRQALLNKADDILGPEDKNLEKRLEHYREDLLIYAMQRKMIEEQLSTEVSPDEIEAYYQNNKQNFELKENIVRLVFFELPADLRNISRLWKKFQNGDVESLNEVMAAAIEKETNFHRDEDTWLRFNDILKVIPITSYNQENYLSNHKVFRVEEGNSVFFVRIIDFRIKNSISPLEFESERIRSIIINKRKVEMLKQIEDNIVQEAYEKNKININ